MQSNLAAPASASPAHRSFADLKALLAEHGGEQLPVEVKVRVHGLCSDFLGGAWKVMQIDDMVLTRMKGGMSNMLFLCRLTDEIKPLHNEPEKVLLRVYFNPETESHLVAESVIFTLLSERHLGPRLFGIFNGGRLEEYIESRPLFCPEIRRPETSSQIARKLAHVHKLSVPISKEPTYICEALDRWITHLLAMVVELTPFKLQSPSSKTAKVINSNLLRCEIETVRFITKIQSLRDCQKMSKEPIAAIEASTSRGRKKILTILDLTLEVELILRCIYKCKSPVLFCHNDLQEGNILLPSSASMQDLVFIDFEYASYNYRAFDFANHFCEWAIDYSSETPPYYAINWDDFPNFEEQANFFRAYLQASRGDGFEITDADVQALIDETMPFVPLSHFFWGVWALLQVELSPVKFGFAEYGRQRLAIYFDQKKQLLSLLNSGDQNGALDAEQQQSSMFFVEPDMSDIDAAK